MSILTKEQRTVEQLLPDIRATHKEFLKTGQETVELARQIGDMLLKLKECVKQGDWVKLVEQRCEFTIRAAQNYMKVAGGWDLLEKSESAATTIDSAVKLISQATPKKKGKTKSVRKSPTTSDSPGRTSKQDDAKEGGGSNGDDDDPVDGAELFKRCLEHMRLSLKIMEDLKRIHPSERFESAFNSMDLAHREIKEWQRSAKTRR